jgi:GntR family transcriptional regulator
MPDQPKRRRKRGGGLSYLQMANHLEGRIADGEWEVDDQLPSYAQLARMYGVSVSTVARAISLLRDRRVVYGHPGLGVFVAEEQ